MLLMVISFPLWWIAGWGDDILMRTILGGSIMDAYVLKYLRATLVFTVFGPLFPLAVAHMYYDLRIRKERPPEQPARGVEPEPTQPAQIPWPDSWQRGKGD